MSNKTQIVEMDIKDLIKANWNYKTEGTEEQISKLMNSIDQDNSIGVLAVRELDKKFEVIDGNHRLEAIKRLGWEKVPCENFGPISKANAITIARRRNHAWFEDDVLKYAEIFKKDVLSEFSIDDLEAFMPDNKEEMEILLKLDEFDFDQYDTSQEYDEDLKTINIKVPDSVYDEWIKWKDKIKETNGYETDSKAFEFAIVEANNLVLKDG